MFHHVLCICKKEVAVCLEMHNAAINEKAAVTLHEIRACKALADVFHLWVAERQPYLLHLAGSEKAVDNLNVGAQERHV